MMIDSAIYRIISALDRLAHVLWHAAELPMKNKGSEITKLYFRSGKIEKIHKVINDEYSRELLLIAQGPILNLAITYRDGLTHFPKVFSKVAGAMPVDEWTSPEGKYMIHRDVELSANELFALGNATYHQLLDALKYSRIICEARFHYE